MTAPPPRALALDLGTTLLKAGRIEDGGTLRDVASVAAPALRGEDGVRESDPLAYRAAAEELLRHAAAGVPRGTPLGVASQRSSFLLWRRDDGVPATPLISWQDRRAAGWCARQRDAAALIVERTGLVLSAHYVGPKLAALQQAEPDLRRALHRGELLLGDLDAWLLWCWSGGAVHATDLTMAARTAMLDLASRDWSPRLLALYDVPPAALPRVHATVTEPVPLAAGPAWTAGIADQAAGALAVLDASSVLITLGTGAFVMRPVEASPAGGLERRPGYLTAPIFGGGADGADRWALEGSINGAGAAFERFGPRDTDGNDRLHATDPAPEAFCIPDAAGLGAPHWRPEIGLVLSPAAERLEPADARRVVREGLIFRLREVLEDLCTTAPDRVLLSGGGARDPFVGPGLAAALARPVELLDEPEAGLTGAGRIAAGLEPRHTPPHTTTIDPPSNLGWLRDKYPRWHAWLRTTLER